MDSKRVKVIILASDVDELGGAGVAAVNYYNLLKKNGVNADLVDYRSIATHFESRFGSLYRITTTVFSPLFYIFNPFCLLLYKKILF